MQEKNSYSKPFLNFDDQLSLLRSRGLIIQDERQVLSFLQHTNYYRLAAYTFRFESIHHPAHTLIPGITFEHLLDLYDFDSSLRLLVFAAISPIETAVRTRIAYELASPHRIDGMERGGSFAHFSCSNYRPSFDYANTKKIYFGIAETSKDPRVVHFQKYLEFPRLPIWATIEALTFSQLSIIYYGLVQELQKPITRYFHCETPQILRSWLHSISQVRNQCAHQGRLWDYRIPARLSLPYSWNKKPPTWSLFAVLLAMAQLYRVIDLDAAQSWCCHTKSLILNYLARCPLPTEFSETMGLDRDWQNHPVWP